MGKLIHDTPPLNDSQIMAGFQSLISDLQSIIAGLEKVLQNTGKENEKLRAVNSKLKKPLQVHNIPRPVTSQGRNDHGRDSGADYLQRAMRKTSLGDDTKGKGKQVPR
jgi:ElaB/YqjD/DUF883 family membrane-anchored ribosome-binding protein